MLCLSKPDKSAARRKSLQITLITVIVLLIAQFVIGMGVNLFDAVPYAGSGGSTERALVDGIIQTGPGLEIHALNGLAILSLSVAVLYFSTKTRVGSVVILATLGVGFVLLALIGGISFVLSGFGNNFDSFLMALGFVFAIASYFVEWNICGREAVTLDTKSNSPTGR